MDELFQACLLGDFDKVKTLLAQVGKEHINDIHPDYGYSMLCFALHSGNLRLVKYLLEEGAQPRTTQSASLKNLINAWIATALKKADAALLAIWMSQHASRYIPEYQKIQKGDVTLDDLRQLVQCYMALGLAYGDYQLNENAVHFFELVIGVLQTRSNDLQAQDYRIMTRAHYAVGLIQQETQSPGMLMKFRLAYESITKTITLSAAEGNTDDEDLRMQALCCSQLGELVSNDNQFDRGLAWFKKAIRAANLIKLKTDRDYHKLADFFSSAGSCEYSSQHYDGAIAFYNQALSTLSNVSGTVNPSLRFCVHACRGLAYKAKKEAASNKAPMDETQILAIIAAEQSALEDFSQAHEAFLLITDASTAEAINYRTSLEFLYTYYLHRRNYQAANIYLTALFQLEQKIVKRDQDDYRQIANLIYIHVDCLCHLREFVAAKEMVGFSQNFISLLNPLKPQDILLYKKCAQLADASERAANGVLPVLEGYYLALSTEQGHVVLDHFDIYLTVARALAMEFNDDVYFVTLNLSFNQFAVGCVIAERSQFFREDFDRLCQQIMLAPHSFEKTTVIDSLRKFLYLLCLAADRKQHPMLSPELSTLLKSETLRQDLFAQIDSLAMVPLSGLSLFTLEVEVLNDSTDLTQKLSS